MNTLGHSIGEPPKCDFLIPHRLAFYRMKVRSILRIRVSFYFLKNTVDRLLQGSAMNDWCASVWCGFCVGLQMKAELKRRGLAI
jgi:hypothetical protein